MTLFAPKQLTKNNYPLQKINFKEKRVFFQHF